MLRPQLPTAAETTYQRRLLQRAAARHQLLHDGLIRALTKSPGIEERARRDALEDDLERLLRAIATARAAWAAVNVAPPSYVGDAAERVDRHATQDVGRFLDVPAIPIPGVLTAWARENADLIRSIDDRYFDEVAGVVEDALRSGRATREIAALIRERYEVSRSSARRLARDQIGKLNGQITKVRQVSAGVTHYRRLTAKDSRVRPSHARTHDKIYAWDDPPDIGHPGEDYECRCVAAPIINRAMVA